MSNKNINIKLVKAQYKIPFNNIMDGTKLIYNSKNELAYIFKGNSCILEISYYFKSIKGQMIFWDAIEKLEYDYKEIEEFINIKYNLPNFKLSIINKQKYKLRPTSVIFNETNEKRKILYTYMEKTC